MCSLDQFLWIAVAVHKKLPPVVAGLLSLFAHCLLGSSICYNGHWHSLG